MHAYNKITRVRGRVESSLVSKKERDRLVAKAEKALANEWHGWKVRCSDNPTNGSSSFHLKNDVSYKSDRSINPQAPA